MPNFLLTNWPVFIILGLTFGLIFLRKHFLKKHQNIPEDLNQARAQSASIIHSAIKKSQDILGLAELESTKITADTKHFQEKLKHDYTDSINRSLHQDQSLISDDLSRSKQDITHSEVEFISYIDDLRKTVEQNQTEVQSLVQKNHEVLTYLNAQIKENINGQLEKAQKQFLDYIAQLQQRSEQMEVSAVDAAKIGINKVFENFEQRISDFLMESEQKTTSAIELELRSARQLIDTYKVQQLQIVDENVIAMLEKTLSLVISKKLNLKDQMDLVYESLEQAKLEKFIV